jgi:4-hydroxy 2-oxovalerate aldolase
MTNNIKVFDCTIRDGGLVNNFYFEDEFVSQLYKTCVEAGIDYMEIGKNNSPTLQSPDDFGIWNFCKEEDIRRIVGENNTDLKIAVMSDIGRTVASELLPKKDSVVDMIRIATYLHQMPQALELLEDASNKGYETTVNIMAVAKEDINEVEKAIELLSTTSVDVIYIADTFGSYYPQQMRELAIKYKKLANGKQVGIHAHNNIQLAFANTIEAKLNGVNFLDVTVSGLGRGAGNCSMELLLGYLQGDKYNLMPVIKFIEQYIVPLEKELDWGCSVPYILSGQLIVHPKQAMKARDENDTKYSKFYNMLLEENK